MIPGLPKILSCPKCGYLAMIHTYMSRNTLRAKQWSDGKVTASGWPESPDLVLCRNCDKFYWVRNAGLRSNIMFNSEDENKQNKIDYIEFPTFHQYFRALETITDEYYIRTCIWHSFNDYFRKGNENQITPEMEKLHNENLNILLNLMDSSDDTELISDSKILSKAEILRNLGRFEESCRLLEKLKDPDLMEIKEIFLREIEKRNTILFRVF